MRERHGWVLAMKGSSFTRAIGRATTVRFRMIMAGTGTEGTAITTGTRTTGTIDVRSGVSPAAGGLTISGHVTRYGRGPRHACDIFVTLQGGEEQAIATSSGIGVLAMVLVCPAMRAQSPDLRGIYVGGNNIVNENAKSLTAALTVSGVDAGGRHPGPGRASADSRSSVGPCSTRKPRCRWKRGRRIASCWCSMIGI